MRSLGQRNSTLPKSSRSLSATRAIATSAVRGAHCHWLTRERSRRGRRGCDCCSSLPATRGRARRFPSTAATANWSPCSTWAGRTSNWPSSTTGITTGLTDGNSTKTFDVRSHSRRWVGPTYASPPRTRQVASSLGCQRPGRVERALRARNQPKSRRECTLGAGNQLSSGALGVNTTGIASRPLTKFAGRRGRVESSSASRRSGSRLSTRSVIIESSRRASWFPRQK